MMPGTCFSPNFEMAFRAFFSLREWTATEAPAGMPASPSPPAASTSDSELSDASSTSTPFLFGSSSGNSSMRGFDMMERCADIQFVASAKEVSRIQK